MITTVWQHACNASQCVLMLFVGQEIRLKGRNLTETEYVKLGAYHTLELELQRAFQIDKVLWDTLDLDRIKQACDPAASADLAAVLITASSCTSIGIPSTIQLSILLPQSYM